jgi:hypothetical protein
LQTRDRCLKQLADRFALLPAIRFAGRTREFGPRNGQGGGRLLSSCSFPHSTTESGPKMHRLLPSVQLLSVLLDHAYDIVESSGEELASTLYNNLFPIHVNDTSVIGINPFGLWQRSAVQLGCSFKEGAPLFASACHSRSVVAWNRLDAGNDLLIGDIIGGADKRRIPAIHQDREIPVGVPA